MTASAATATADNPIRQGVDEAETRRATDNRVALAIDLGWRMAARPAAKDENQGGEIR